MDKKVIIKRITLFIVVVLVFVNVTKTTHAGLVIIGDRDPTDEELDALTPVTPPPPDTQGQLSENTPSLTYKLLAPIGETTEVSPSQFGSYLQLLINISIGITGAIAVLMLIIGGLEYVLAGVNEATKTDAKSRITNAILGLLLVLSCYLILNTINPDLVKLGLPRIGPLKPLPVQQPYYGKNDRRPGEEGLTDEEFEERIKDEQVRREEEIELWIKSLE